VCVVMELIGHDIIIVGCGGAGLRAAIAIGQD
jgi:succinate dehydrogenase/fumarate reductase flavoprotein subunit